MLSCTNCGTSNDDRAAYCQKCGQQITAPAAAALPTGIPAVHEAYGGFWKRVLAWLIDALVVGAGTGIIIAATFGVGVVVLFCGHWLYEAFMTSSAWQATLGKRALNMVVTDENGGRLSFGRATGRHFAKWLSAMVLCIGFIIVAFTPKKQGLHDMIAETYVVSR
jgi:uncharacterized RDD family membrane protein YckC